MRKHGLDFFPFGLNVKIINVSLHSSNTHTHIIKYNRRRLISLSLKSCLWFKKCPKIVCRLLNLCQQNANRTFLCAFFRLTIEGAASNIQRKRIWYRETSYFSFFSLFSLVSSSLFSCPTIKLTMFSSTAKLVKPAGQKVEEFETQVSQVNISRGSIGLNK